MFSALEAIPVADPGGARGARSSPPFCQGSIKKVVDVDKIEPPLQPITKRLAAAYL